MDFFNLEKTDIEPIMHTDRYKYIYSLFREELRTENILTCFCRFVINRESDNELFLLLY